MSLSRHPIPNAQARATAVRTLRQLKEKMEGVWSDYFAPGNAGSLPAEILQQHLCKETAALEQQIAKALGLAFGADSSSVSQFYELKLATANSVSFMNVQLFLDTCLAALLPEPAVLPRTSPLPSSMSGLPSILIVDDSEDTQLLCARALRQDGLRLAAVGSAEEALRYLDTSHVDVIVLDYMLPPPMFQLCGTSRRSRVMNGVGLMHEVLVRWSRLNILFISGQPAAKLRAQGVPPHVPILEKPFRGEVFHDAVLELLPGTKRAGASHTATVPSPRLVPRKQRRVIVRCPVTLEGETTTAGQMQDLSETGCKLSNASPLRVGSHVTLKMILPSTETIKINVAIVRWSRAGECGLEFLWTDQAMLSHLRNYLRRFTA
jgi:CheY-like chemotaxis protein